MDRLQYRAPALLENSSCGVLRVAELPVRVQLRDAPDAIEPMLGTLALVDVEWADEHARIVKVVSAAHHLSSE